jgi:hypothetical protein
VPSVSNGENNGFRVHFDAESYDYSSTLSGTEGFVISILHHHDIPIMKHTGIQISTGQSVSVAVTPTLLDTTSICKRRFTPSERQCYFEDEILLQHFPPLEGYRSDFKCNYKLSYYLKLNFRYEMANCLFEATLQKIEKNCGCTPTSFVDIDDNYRNSNPCLGSQKLCMNQLNEKMGSDRTIVDRGQTKECLAACKDQERYNSS